MRTRTNSNSTVERSDAGTDYDNVGSTNSRSDSESNTDDIYDLIIVSEPDFEKTFFKPLANHYQTQ